MKDAASTAQREQNQRQGLIVGTITLPFRLLGVLIGSLLFSIVVECVGMHLFWKYQLRAAVPGHRRRTTTSRRPRRCSPAPRSRSTTPAMPGG